MANEIPTDTNLVQMARTGDEQAAARLYHRHADAVHRICYRVLLDTAAAKDCGQDVWYKVFRQLHRYDAKKSFAGWLKTIAVRTAIDFYRKRGGIKHVGMDESAIEMFHFEPESARQGIDDRETQRRIEAALATLSVTQRAAFVMRHFEGESIEAIARQLNCRPGTVNTHIYRAVKALQEKLAPLKEVIDHADRSASHP